MNLRLLWLASFASLMWGLSGPTLCEKLYSDPSGHHASPNQLVGCKIDPEGHCVPQSGSASSDKGAFIDPNGGTARPSTTTATTEPGSSMDPNGN